MVWRRTLLEGLRDGRKADGFAGEPANALEGEERVGGVGEGFVLCGLLGLVGSSVVPLGMRCVGGRRELRARTMIHLPLRSLIVLFAGAAMVLVCGTR